jgi:hypothetical protein
MMWMTMRMMKKQMVAALVLLLLIPMVLLLGGLLFSLINPEIAAGHPNYARDYDLLSMLKITLALGSAAVAGILWLLACFLAIRSKKRSSWWILFAALGPVGFAILARLRDKSSAETDPHTRFVQSLNRFVRVGYEVGIFVAIWLLAYQAMVLKRNLMILYQSATTGISTAQIVNLQNASSGMWAFSEGMELMYIVVLLYVIWPVAFNLAARVAAIMASPRTSHLSKRSDAPGL